jgi:tetratricopeptide (TPR) repeat protein
LADRTAWVAALALAANGVLAMPALAANSPALAPRLAQAVQALQSGEWAKAAAMLEPVTKNNPGDAAAWRALATAYQNLKDYDGAIAAFRRALNIEPDSPKVFYSLGDCYAAKSDREAALAWFERARASRRYDMTQLTVDPAVAGLRGDARLRALLPLPADFAQPFVEPVKIIREWRGEAANDQFGWIARSIGDVDGDGIGDFVTSAPTHGAGGSNAGRIYVYSTRSGKLLWFADGSSNDQLGTGVEAAGDTNGDGIPDVVASGPGASGVAFIYSGRDGRVLRSFKSNNADEAFGNHIAAAGDFNHDGFADVIIGAPGKEGQRKIAGNAYVYSGKDGALLATLKGERRGDAFGSTVAGYSNAGGERFVVIGAPGAGAQHHGRVYVYSRELSKPRFIIDADASGNALGLMFVAVSGDIDGDGVSDIVASDWSNSAKGPSTGRIYVHSGKTGRRLLTLTGETAGEGFGTSPSIAGDVDGDGRADLIVGAWQYGKAAVSGGRAYLFSGRDGRLLRTYTDRIPGDTLGFDAVGIGDVDGDGTVDFLITAAWSGVNGFHSGRVFIISSGVARSRRP